MFARLLWRLLRGNGGRLAIALVAVASGAAVISALLNMEIDVRRKIGQEFRSLGANLVIARYGGGDPATLGEKAIMDSVGRQAPPGTIAAPFLYLVAQDKSNHAVVLAGTYLDAAEELNSSWKIDGDRVASRDDLAHCLVGRNVARQFGLAPGATLELHAGGNSQDFVVAGVITSGGDEDNQVVANLAFIQKLAGLAGRVELVQLRVPGTATDIRTFAEQFRKSAPMVEVRAIAQIAETEGALLGKIRLLIVSMSVLILVLTTLCVLATMAALAMERRADVGLMKALGGSIGRIVGLFFAEATVLGGAGGVAGYFLGAALTIWIGRRVFGAAIAPRAEVFPLTVAMAVAVAVAGAFPLRLLGRVKPAVIFRGEG